MPTRNSSHRQEIDETSPQKSLEDAVLCNQILDADRAIRAAAIVEGDQVSGFALAANTPNLLGRDDDFREKIGFWVRLVTEIARKTENHFGNLDSIDFTFETLKLVTFPLSSTRSVGISLDRSANPVSVIGKVRSQLDPSNGRRDHHQN